MTYLDYVEPLKLPKIISDEDKELINLVKKDVLLDDSNPIMFKDVIGLVMILEFQTLFRTHIACNNSIYLFIFSKNEAKEAIEDVFLLPLQHPDVYKDQGLSKVHLASISTVFVQISILVYLQIFFKGCRSFTNRSSRYG